MLQKLLDQIQRLPVSQDICPKSHAILDYLTASYFLLLGSAFWNRNRRAAASAVINGCMVLGVSLLTDYDGDGKRPISFETHGQLDVAQALTAAGLPVLLGFSNKAAALPFQIQAVNEVLVLGKTDFTRSMMMGMKRAA
jgi:hypothetical protein